MSRSMNAVVIASTVMIGLVAVMAACSKNQAAVVEPRGREEMAVPAAHATAKASAAKTPPAPKAQQDAALPALALPGCRSLDERFASLVKAAPDAIVVKRYDAPDKAIIYVNAFNAVHDEEIRADQVLIVHSDLWGDRVMVLFERKGCESGTAQVNFGGAG